MRLVRSSGRVWWAASLAYVVGCGSSETEVATSKHSLCGHAGYTAVWQIQGSGGRSLFAGKQVSDVRGVVTTSADIDGWHGFFIQAHEPDCRPETSDGIFVALRGHQPHIEPGILVGIDRAEVLETGSGTRLLCNANCSVNRLGRAEVEPVSYRPPASAQAARRYGQAHEGMLVWVDVPATVVGATDRNNQTVVMAGEDREPLHPTSANLAERLFIDGSLYAGHCGDGPLRLRAGDTTAFVAEQGWAIQGPLLHRWGHFRILQDGSRSCIGIKNPRPIRTSPDMAPSDWKIATLNAHNLFDDQDNLATADVVRSAANVRLQLEKLTETLCSSDYLDQPDVVALQEVENLDVVRAIADETWAGCGASYQALVSEGPDARGMQIGFLVARGILEELQPLQTCTGQDWGLDQAAQQCPPGQFLLHPREPLEIQVKLGAASATIVNVHLKSRLASRHCQSDDCGDWRTAEIVHLADHVRGALRAHPNRHLIVMGDFNATDAELWPLLDSGLVDATAHFGDTQPAYTYLYEGVRQNLDRILLSGAALALATDAHVRHANADFEAALAERPGAQRSSDHDPALVTLSSKPPPVPKCSSVSSHQRPHHRLALPWFLAAILAALRVRRERVRGSRSVRRPVGRSV